MHPGVARPAGILPPHPGAGDRHRIVDPGVIGQAAGLFAATDIGGVVILALFFAQGAGVHLHCTCPAAYD